MASLVIRGTAISYWQTVTSYFKAGLQWCFDQSFPYSTCQVTKNNMRNETERGIFSPFWCILFNAGLCHCQHLAFLQYCNVFLIFSCMRKGRVSNQGLFILPWTFLSLPNHTTFQNLGYYDKSKCRCLHLLLKKKMIW